MADSSIQARHILVDHEHQAQDILRKLKEGSSFEEMAQKYSKCPSGQMGGDLGSFSKGQMVSEFEESAFSLQKGEISGPVRTKFGYHLIQRYE